jgi:hypothetical protein
VNGTKETYQLIADTISKTLPAERLISRLESFSNWEELVMVGSQQLLLPLLYRSLEQKGLIKNLPDDLADYLNEIHHINLNRNKAILHQLRDLHALFEKHHIDYVLIKGAAILVRLREEDLGLRMVGDIDLLIPSGANYSSPINIGSHTVMSLANPLVISARIFAIWTGWSMSNSLLRLRSIPNCLIKRTTCFRREHS